MKKILFALLLLACSVAHAQITYETRYPVQLQAFKLSTGVVKYIGYFPNSNSINIYNNDNSLYKAVAMPAGTTYAYGDFFYLSDKLFNNDSQLEFATAVGANNNFVMKVYNENGNQLFSQDSCTNAQIYNTPLGTKMFARVYRANSGSYFKVYALAGTYTPLAVRAGLADASDQAYPNPTTSDIRLPYSVPAGQVASLTVRDAAGRSVASYQVDNTFGQLLFSTRGLAPGVYFYTVGAGPSRRFTVQ